MIKPENQTNELLRYQLALKETENAKLRKENEAAQQDWKDSLDLVTKLAVENERLAYALKEIAESDGIDAYRLTDIAAKALSP